MQLKVDAKGVQALRARLAQARAQLPALMKQAVHDAGTQVSKDLSSAAPSGQAGGPPPQGDAPGKLSQSFYVQDEASKFNGAACTVRTRQPQKLEYVTKGTGIHGPKGQRIYPLTKKALYWPGAQHPVRSVAGQKPNDFVTPALANAPTAQTALGAVTKQLKTILES